MKAYQDKETGKWKWGTNGKPIYDTKLECQRYGLKAIEDALNRMAQRKNKLLQNHGR